MTVDPAARKVDISRRLRQWAPNLTFSSPSRDRAICASGSSTYFAAKGRGSPVGLEQPSAHADERIVCLAVNLWGLGSAIRKFQSVLFQAAENHLSISYLVEQEQFSRPALRADAGHCQRPEIDWA